MLLNKRRNKVLLPLIQLNNCYTWEKTTRIIDIIKKYDFNQSKRKCSLCNVDFYFFSILLIQIKLLLFKNLTILKFLNSNNMFCDSDIEKVKHTLYNADFLFSIVNILFVESVVVFSKMYLFILRYIKNTYD